MRLALFFVRLMSQRLLIFNGALTRFLPQRKKQGTDDPSKSNITAKLLNVLITTLNLLQHI